MPAKPHGQRSLEGYSPGDHKRVGHDLATKQQLWKIIQRFFRKLRVELPHSLAFSLLSIYLKKTKALIQKDICTSVFIATLFTIPFNIRDLNTLNFPSPFGYQRMTVYPFLLGILLNNENEESPN